MNPFLDRPASYAAESKRLSCFLRALVFPLVILALHLLAGCETITDANGNTIRRILPPENIHIHIGESQK